MKRKLLLALLSLLCVLAFAATGTYAWLSKTQTPDEKVYTALSDFEVTGTLSFGGTVYQNGSDVMIPIGLTKGSANYIGDMKYEVVYRGVSPAYIRVRILEQWLDRTSGDIKSMPYMTYTVTNDVESIDIAGKKTVSTAGNAVDNFALAEAGVWVDHRSVDFAYYYSVPVQPKLLVNTGAANNATLSDGAVKFTIIDQNGVSPLPEGINTGATDLSLLIQVEAVQPNRFREFWNIDAIPQP